MKTKSRGKQIATKITGTLIIPVIVLVVLEIICVVNGKQMISNLTSFNNFIIYTAIVMITTMALSVNLNSGRFDFSLGSMALLSSVVSAKITYSILGSGGASAIVMLLLSIAVGALIGLFSGFVYVLLKIPPIITSLGITLIFEGITYTITEGKYVMSEVQNPSMAAFSATWIWPLLIILVVLAFMIIVFDHTRFGFNYNALRNGQKVSVNTGIKEISNAVVCYMICGGLMGIVGFLNTVRNSNINGGQLNFASIGIMFTAFLPMFIGGYIGRYSNDKLGYLLAALCMSMLNSTFAAFSNEISASMQAIINAILLVVFLIYLNNEGLLKKIFKPVRKTEAA
ncbi:MAG: sugar ABC transporter permease [Parasporobacterium sp.]|nr:sugar ABC transporter permease [Parasporobacterium sp.]